MPVVCCLLGLTLVSAPHLARSYQHLFPLPAFEEVKQSEEQQSNNTRCFIPLNLQEQWENLRSREAENVPEILKKSSLMAKDVEVPLPFQ